MKRDSTRFYKINKDPYLQNQVKNRIIKGYGDLQAFYKRFLTTKPKVTDGEIKIDWQGKNVQVKIEQEDNKYWTTSAYLFENMRQWQENSDQYQ